MTAEEILVRNCLLLAVQQFSSNMNSAATMRRFATDVGDLFTVAATELLTAAEETGGYRYLALLLSRQPSLFKHLSNPWKLTRTQAADVSQRILDVDPSLDTRFARQLPAQNGVTPDTLMGPHAERALDILDVISPGRRVVPILSHLTRDIDQKISSKAALLIGRRVQNVAFARRLLMESSDPRVRANAIESVWGSDATGARELFWEFANDEHNRVVGNALMGLYLAGDSRAAGLVRALAREEKPDFRMTSAWTMGRMGNCDFVPDLTPLVKDVHAGVRSAALRSLQSIRQVEKLRRPSEAPAAEALPPQPGEPAQPEEPKEENPSARYAFSGFVANLA